MINKNLLNKILIGVIIVLSLIIFKQCSDDPETIEVPINIEVPVPVVEHHFDTIKEPYPVYITDQIIDSTYYALYVKIKDSIKNDSIFKDAITIREYNEIFDDTIQTINIYSKVQGFLKAQTSSYKTKPRTIQLDTVLSLPIPYKVRFGSGIEFGYLKDNPLLTKVNLEFDTRKVIYKTGVDTDKRIWGGITVKF